jgi:adenylate cyclase
MLAVALLVLGSDAGAIGTRLRGILFDAYQHSSPRTYEDTRAKSGFSVRVLDIDDASIQRFGAWPWPHAVLARLTREMKSQGASMVVFAMKLDKPDPASPRNLLGLVPPGPNFDNTRIALERMPSPDTALASAFAGIATVTGFELGRGGPSAPLALKASIAHIGTKDPFGETPDFDSANGPIPDLQGPSAGLGALNLAADADGKLRRVPIVLRWQGKPVPSLDAEVLRLAQSRPVVTVRGTDTENNLLNGASGIASIEAQNVDLPAAPDGSIWVAYAGAHAERDISAAALDQNALEAGRLQNAIVYVGSPSDVAMTPDGQASVATIHAEAMENILLGTALRRPASAITAEMICLALFGLGTVFLFARFGVLWAGAFAGAAAISAGAVSWHLYVANHVLFDALGPSFGLACVFGVGAIGRFVEVSGTRARLRSAFADALSSEAIEKIAHKPSLLKLDGENRTVTYLACGIRDFANLAESFRDDPVAFTRLLQRVVAPLMDEALAHGGTVDRVTSDGFTCFWNAPLDDPEHAIHACEAASGMMEVIAKTNDIVTHERRIDGVALAPVEIGIGISTSSAIAGGFRAHGRTAYSVNGECTVLASSIQAQSGQYGPAIIVSEDTRKASERGFAFLEVDYIAAGAHDEPVKLYAMLGNPVMRASPKFRALITFHDHIFQSLRTQQWQKTRELIDQCRKLSGASQKLYDLHLARVAYFEANPPGPDWDGAFRPILK